MLIKRRYSDPAAAGGNNANLDITASRQTEKKATELCSFAITIYGGAFWDLCVFSTSMGYGDLRVVFQGEW